MAPLRILLLVLLGLVVANATVTVLTSSKMLDKSLAQHDVLFVHFCSSFDKACKAINTKFNAAALLIDESVESDDTGAQPPKFARVNCGHSGGEELCDELEIDTYPTMWLFIDGDRSSPIEYDSEEYDEESLVNFALAHSLPPIQHLKSLNETQKFIRDSHAGKQFIGLVLQSPSDNVTEPVMETVARKLRTRSIVIGSSKVDEVRQQYNVNADAETKLVALVAHPDNSSIIEHVEFKGSLMNASQVTSFLQLHSYPVFGELDDANLDKYFESGLPTMMIFINVSDVNKTQELKELVEPVAKEMRGQVLIGYMDGVEFSDDVSKMGVVGLPGVALRTLEREMEFKYPMNSEITAESLRKLFSDWQAQKLQPHMLSEPVPTENKEPVRVLVGTTFQAEVMDMTKDVLVDFYAPWCGYCKKMQWTYLELAEKYATDPNIVIAKIDANANDFSVPNFEVTGYPTLALFPAGDKTPILFEEDEMTTRAMWNFVRVNRKSMPSKKPVETPVEKPVETPAAPADQVKDEL